LLTAFLNCDNCGLKKSVDAKYASRRVKCPSCGQTVHVLAQTPLEVTVPPPISSHQQSPPHVESPPPFIDTSRSSSNTTTRQRPNLNSAKKLILFSGFCGVTSSAAMATLGLFLSQYWPVFGGVLEKVLAQPWSPARTGLIPIHIFVFSLTGLILGAGFGAAFVTLVASNKNGR